MSPTNCPRITYLYHPKPQLFQPAHLSFELCGPPRSVNSPPSSSRLAKNEVQWTTIRHYFLLFWLQYVTSEITNFMDPPHAKQSPSHQQQANINLLVSEFSVWIGHCTLIIMISTRYIQYIAKLVHLQFQIHIIQLLQCMYSVTVIDPSLGCCNTCTM